MSPSSTPSGSYKTTTQASTLDTSSNISSNPIWTFHEGHLLTTRRNHQHLESIRPQMSSPGSSQTPSGHFPSNPLGTSFEWDSQFLIAIPDRLKCTPSEAESPPSKRGESSTPRDQWMGFEIFCHRNPRPSALAEVLFYCQYPCRTSAVITSTFHPPSPSHPLPSLNHQMKQRRVPNIGVMYTLANSPIQLQR